MNLLHQTKGNTSPQGKKTIFIHAAKEDERHREYIENLFFKLENGHTYAVWHAEEPFEVFDEPEEFEYLGAALYIPVITKHYLAWCDTLGHDRLREFFASLLKKGTAILPMFKDREVITAFNGIAKNIHAICFEGSQTVPLLKIQLARFFPDDEMYDIVKEEAFNGKLFLSYRKVDIAYAYQVMKALHDTQAAGSAAIWIDDFLVTGSDFWEQIQEELRACDAVAMVITPRMLDEGNFVRTDEYRTAHQVLGKTIIPIQAVRTDPAALADAFEGIGDVTNVDAGEALEKILYEKGFRPRENSPYENYLLGLAFYRRINVENDMERAGAYLEMAALHGNVDALMQLAFFYISGIGGTRDHDRAIKYLLRAYDRLKNRFERDKVGSIHKMYQLLYGTDGLCLLLKSRGRCVEARTLSKEFLDRLYMVSRKEVKNYALYRAEAYAELADTHFDKNISATRLKDAKRYSEQGLDFIRKCGSCDDELTYMEAVLHTCLARCYQAEGNAEKAVSAYKKAKEMTEELVKDNEKLEYMRLSASISVNLGMLFRERGFEKMMQNPAQSIRAMEPAVRELNAALFKARRIVAIQPPVDNRETLAIALEDLGLVTADKKQAVGYLEESLAIAQELAAETGEEELKAFRDEVESVLRKRRGFFSSLFGKKR